MTLRNKYVEIMERVAVTEEMRGRILGSLRGAETAPAGKVVRFPHWRKYAAAAACLAVLLLGALTVPGILHPAGENPSVDAQGSEGIVECQSAEELSQSLGFPVSDLAVLPFETKNAVYLSSWGEVAEIDYTGTDGQTASYRKSKGTEDNSGDYDTFADTEQRSVGAVSATIKGDGSAFTLAFWTDGTYAYSVVLSEGVSADQWDAIISGAS